MAAPVVAIPAYHLAAGRVSRWTAGGYAVPETYVHGLRRAGVRGLIVPAGDSDVVAAEVLAPFDGLLLVGGGDLDAARYGEAAGPENYGTEPDRDELELGLARHAVAVGMPVLAVCRGMQLMNVALGGSLLQHLPDRHDLLAHGLPAGGPPGCHEIKVADGSRLSDAVGGATTIVNCTSYHHQGVDRIGDGLVATGWSPDGLVEALELPVDAPRWLLAVQWHPEMTAADDPAQQALFQAFASVL